MNTSTSPPVITSSELDVSPIILVVEDVHETRDGIEKLLIADGYRVALARDEQDAIENAHRTRPDLILVSLGGLPLDVVLSARSIRQRAEVGEHVPVIVFCIEGLAEGEEVEIGEDVYLTRPDNFNQLRRFIARLLNRIPTPLKMEVIEPSTNRISSP